MIEFIVGAVMGAAGGYVAKDTILGSKRGGKNTDMKSDAVFLSDENEKLQRRNTEAELRIEELMAENERLLKKNKDVSEEYIDLEEERDMLKSRIRKLLAANADLERRLQEVKTICDSLQNELDAIKRKQ